MRLISCHIESFGVLSSEDISFNDDLNITIKENGWGKSTLASFLRAMFYGLNGEGKKDELTCERKRFAPWQGGSFGGSVTFETGGKKYVLSRFFGAKASEDSFELRDLSTNLLSKDFSDNIGEELFSINAESFMKTIYISQNDSSNTSVTDDINAKLGNITDSIDLNKYASAQESLKDALNAYSKTRKTGEIYKLKERQSLLKSRILASNGVEDVLREIEGRMSQTKEKINEAKDKLDFLSSQKAAVSQYEKCLNLKKTYDKLLEEISIKEKQKKERRAFFKGNVPSLNECKAWEEACDKIKEADAVIKDTAMSEAETLIFSNLLEMFKDEVPSESKIEDLLIKARELSNNKTLYAKYALTDEEKDTLENFNEVFDSPLNAENEVNRCIEDVSLLNKYSNECAGLSAKLDEDNRKKGGFSILGSIFIFFSFAFAFVSFLFRGLVVSRYYTYIGFFLAVVFLILGVVLFITHKRKTQKDPLLIKAEERLNELYEKIDVNKEYVSNFLSKFDMPFDEERVSFDLQNLSRSIYEYKTLYDKKKQLDKVEGSNDLDQVQSEIKEFLSKYGVFARDDELTEKLADLKGKAKHFESLKQKSDALVRAKANKESIKNDLVRALLGYQIEPGLDISKTVTDVYDVVTEYDSVCAILNDANERLKAFLEENDLALINETLSNESMMTFDEIHEKERVLNETLEELRSNLSTDSRTYDDYEQKFEQRQEETEELTSLTSEIEEKTNKLSLVSVASDYLAKAKEILTQKYMEPLLKGFIKYYSYLTKEDAKSFHIDANMVITKEEKGMQRSTGFLSLGYKDLIGFCMRLAVADAMYEEERPMLILDDPFVNLDDKKVAEAKRLLKEVSKYYQIIYLTCSESRL